MTQTLAIDTESSAQAAVVAVQRARRARRAVSDQPKMQLSFRCVDIASSGSEMDEFQLMLDKAREVSFATFARHVDWKPIAQQMGYATGNGAEGLRLDKDYAVSFYASRHDGERVYYMIHSAIEYVFKKPSGQPSLKMRSPWE